MTDDDALNAPTPQPSPARKPRTDRSLDPALSEPKTDPGFRVDAQYLWDKLEEERAERAAERVAEEHRLKASGWIRTTTAIVVLIGGIGGGLLVVLSEARAQARQEVAATDAGLQGLKPRVVTLEGRFDRFEERIDKQMNLALDKLRRSRLMAVRASP